MKSISPEAAVIWSGIDCHINGARLAYWRGMLTRRRPGAQISSDSRVDKTPRFRMTFVTDDRAPGALFTAAESFGTNRAETPRHGSRAWAMVGRRVDWSPDGVLMWRISDAQCGVLNPATLTYTCCEVIAAQADEGALRGRLSGRHFCCVRFNSSEGGAISRRLGAPGFAGRVPAGVVLR
jgi:hypothetical protein